MKSISLVVPVYNEANTIATFLEHHQNHFTWEEVILVDGGSEDNTISRIEDVGEDVKLLRVEAPGRGRQLSRGVNEARSDWILMLHADTLLPQSFNFRQFQPNSGWGWFDCRLDDAGWRFQFISRAISIRSAIFSTPTGDQAIWVRNDLLQRVGGIPEAPIMEDVLLVKALRRVESGQRVRYPVTTSARKWKREGVFKVIFLMWFFRFAHTLGASPEWIYRCYYGRSPEDNGKDK